MAATLWGLPPVGFMFPYGCFSFTISGINPPGSTVTVYINLPSNVPAASQYFKYYGGSWVNVTSLVGDNDGDNLITLTLTDGGPGDADGVANGTIVDPGMPAIPVGIGTLEVASYRDYNRNGGRDKDEPMVGGFGFTISGPNGYSASGVTDASGLLTVPNLTAGMYTVTDNLKSPENAGGAWFSTDSQTRVVIVPGNGVGRVEFGNEYNPKVPASSDTGLWVMIGSFALLIGILVFRRERRQRYSKR
jgi:hypothetical protein